MGDKKYFHMKYRDQIAMQIAHPEIGVCGLSCRLCPTYHTAGKSRCRGCKSHTRMAVGCPFITCAIKKKGIVNFFGQQRFGSFRKINNVVGKLIVRGKIKEAVMAFPMIVSLMLCLAMIFDDTAWDNEDA